MSASTTAARSRKIAFAASAVFAVVLLLAALTGAATPERGPAGPDVIVGDLNGVWRYSPAVGGITAYSVGTTSCNEGGEVLPWDADTNAHPVIAQNMYRLKDGRFQQVGMSWLKHGFAALTQNLCNTCDNPFNSQLLGVGCSDTYSAFLNGDRVWNGLVGGLGPRSEVDAATGSFPFPYCEGVPYCEQGDAGDDEIYKRLQVHHTDLDPAQNAGARYFVEGHYISAADAAAGLDDNNASYREVTVGAAPYAVVFAGDTQREKPAILAWQDVDPAVTVTHADVAGDGRLTLAARATDLGGGQWRYEYALYNMSSHRSARAFTVPVPVGGAVQNTGFSDVDYHSGEPYDGTDWTPAAGSGTGTVSWSTSLFAVNENANALRWGTLYNFWFDADSAPVPASAEIGLFRPGSPASVSVSTVVPAGIFSDGFESGNVSAWSSSAP